MKPILFVTSNSIKVETAQDVCKRFGITLEQMPMDIMEIQADDGESVARDKALRVFEELQRPVVISDDTWLVPALNNFPGPYMKYIQSTLDEAAWHRLIAPLTDRRIALRQYIVYQDAQQQMVFHEDLEGILLNTPRGPKTWTPMQFITFNGGDTTAAEDITHSGSLLNKNNIRTGWHAFCEWLNARGSV